MKYSESNLTTYLFTDNSIIENITNGQKESSQAF